MPKQLPSSGSTPLEDVLSDLRVSGNVLLHESYVAPWAIDIPDQRTLRTMLGASPDARVIPFHLVKRGEFELRGADTKVFKANCSDVVFGTGGMAHQMRRGRASQVVPLKKILEGKARLKQGEGAQSTELICGVFVLQGSPLNPLLSALPNYLRCSTFGPTADPMLARAADLLVAEVTTPDRQLGAYSRSRLLEIFYAEAIRTYQSQSTALRIGWLNGLRDPKISAAIARVHSNPAADWSVAALARAVSLSPSRFAARFRDTVGITVMQYATNWRMGLACRLLADRDSSIDAIAARCGYSSVATFSRAFKATLGCAPTKWQGRVSAV